MTKRRKARKRATRRQRARQPRFDRATAGMLDMAYGSTKMMVGFTLTSGIVKQVQGIIP